MSSLRQHGAEAYELTPDEVQQRFGWAMHRGQPFWLWPDIPVPSWQQALDTIATLTRAILADQPVPLMIEGDPEPFLIACYTSGMGPLLGHWLEQGLIRARRPVEAVLELQFAHNRARMAQLEEEARTVTEWLAAHGVATTTFKGMHTAFAYFPEPGARPVSDIDLLIAPADEPRAGEALAQLGFEAGLRSRHPPQQQNWRRAEVRPEPRTLRFVHRDDPWSIDLQTSLNRRYSAGSPVVRLDTAISDPSEEWPGRPTSRVLRQPLRLLQLMVHVSITPNSPNLIRLVEIILVIRSDAGTPGFWDRFVEAGTRAGALGIIYPSLRLCEDLAPGTVPAHVRAESERHVPAKVRAVIDHLTPATAQSVMRCSIKERLMWTSSLPGLIAQLVREVVLVPPELPGDQRIKIYYNRVRRIVNRTLTP